MSLGYLDSIQIRLIKMASLNFVIKMKLRLKLQNNVAKFRL